MYTAGAPKLLKSQLSFRYNKIYKLKYASAIQFHIKALFILKDINITI
jgi:hypothetical protein